MAQESGVQNVKPKAKKSNPSPSPQPKPPAARVNAPNVHRGMSGSFGRNGNGLSRGAGRPTGVISGKRTNSGGGGGGGGGAFDPFSGGGGGGGGGGSFGADLGGISDTDYLAGDAQYQAQLAALMKALQDTEADFGAQKGRYETDFGESLRGLGWTPEMADDPSTPTINEAAPGAWNMQDQNTASGRALTNQQNDFASRGMLQSSLFGRANDDLMRSLNDQLGGMQTGRTSFLDDLARQQSAYKTDNTSQQQQARAEALARRAAGLSL